MCIRDRDILAVSPDGKTLVVVEVKTRSGEEYQQPEEAVDVRKMRNLAIAAKMCIRDRSLPSPWIDVTTSNVS